MSSNNDVKAYANLSDAELKQTLDEVNAEYEEILSKNYSIDMARGKPCKDQLNLSSEMLCILQTPLDCIDDAGIDCRNYGNVEGIPGARALMAELLDSDPECTLALGNSSLTAMYDTVARCLDFGCLGSTPWAAYDRISFICPAPGYDRHFAILEQFGIEMLTVPMTKTGPDMDEVEKLAKDPHVKGIWCVPKFSNPTGVVYSDETVRRLASMEAADDFRIFWDNAYCVHTLYPDFDEHLLDIGLACVEAGHPDRYFKFASTSKITFPGAGICGFASSKANIKEARKLMSAQVVGQDKLNQLRHVRFLPNTDAIKEHMSKHADIIRPKFELVEKKLEEGLKDLMIATWTYPKGGYFISFDGLSLTAKRTVALAKKAGITLTTAGATWPYGKDPTDSNIRIAPTMLSLEELDLAMDVFICCVKKAALEKMSLV